MVGVGAAAGELEAGLTGEGCYRSPSRRGRKRCPHFYLPSSGFSRWIPVVE